VVGSSGATVLPVRAVAFLFAANAFLMDFVPGLIYNLSAKIQQPCDKCNVMTIGGFTDFVVRCRIVATRNILFL
jgi:hypothetical protein